MGVYFEMVDEEAHTQVKMLEGRARGGPGGGGGVVGGAHIKFATDSNGAWPQTLRQQSHGAQRFRGFKRVL